MSGLELAAPEDFDRLLQGLPQADGGGRKAALARQQQLTKPPGSLGRLEEIAVWLAGWQAAPLRLDRVTALIFAGNHGITRHGVSPYPPEVTAQMVANFEAGGAAINQICTAGGIALKVTALELESPTGDICAGPAMSEAEGLAAVGIGLRTVPEDADAIVVGEMGIGNTTIAAALAACVVGGSGADWAGPGTGLEPDGISRKVQVIDAALRLHREKARGPLAALCRLGGREQAAIAGAVLAARRARIPVILDGFVATAAAAVLTLGRPDALDHCIAGHLSREPGHAALLKALELKPVLDLGMRLGEGTGAALAVSVVRAAAAVHTGMATFAEAGVSDRGD